MKIHCPNCQLSGQISDVSVPPEGLNMECPRCKSSFFIRKEATASWHDTSTDCPVCKFSTFSEERFDICPKCGLVIKEYNEQKGKRGVSSAPPAGRAPRQHEAINADEAGRRAEEDLRRLEEKNAKRAHGHGGMPLPSPEHASEAKTVPEVPLPVQLLGGAFIVVALIAIIYSGLEMRTYYAKLREVAGDQLLMEEFAALHSFWGGVVFPGFQVLFGCVVVVVAAFFIRLCPWSRQGLEKCAWAGLVYMAGYEIVSLMNWIGRSSSDATVLYYFIGVMSTLVMVTFWAAPFLAAIWYLRGDTVVDLFDEAAG